MGKSVHNDVLDGALKVIKSSAALITVCSSEPTTYSQATKLAASSGFRLASVAVSSADFAIADGSAGGRKVTVTKQDSVSVDDSGSAQHVAICAAAKVLLVTTCTTQALTKGNKVNIPAFKDTIGDPT
jgi:hypothetical protein